MATTRAAESRSVSWVHAEGAFPGGAQFTHSQGKGSRIRKHRSRHTGRCVVGISGSPLLISSNLSEKTDAFALSGRVHVVHWGGEEGRAPSSH